MLATIRRDAPITFELPVKKWREDFDFSKIEALFMELEFRTLGARVKAVVEGKEEGKVQKVKGKSDENDQVPMINDASRDKSKEGEKKHSRKGLSERDWRESETRREHEATAYPDGDVSSTLPPSVPASELRPIAVGAWLLDSNYTGPTYEDVLKITNAKDWDSAKKAVIEGISDTLCSGPTGSVGLARVGPTF